VMSVPLSLRHILTFQNNCAPSRGNNEPDKP